MEQLRRLFRVVRDSRFKYSPLIKVNIYKSRILKNFDYFRAISNLLVAPVLKSNAYGHGLIKVAKILEMKAGIPFFVVDNYYEALILENERVKKNMLVIGFTQTENLIKSTHKKTAFTISSIQQLQELASSLKQKLCIHIKVDTGMNRQGISYQEIGSIFPIIESNKNLSVEGICSHIASSENSEQLQIQKSRWSEVVARCKKEFPQLRYFHILATSGIAHHESFESNVARIGIGLFGFDLSGRHTEHIMPTLSLTSRIAAVKQIKEGERIGYDGTFIAQKEMRIAVLPVGYYEGLDRRLSNIGIVKINNIDCKIVGRVSMNISTVDVSAVPNISENDEAIIISSERENANSVQSIARELGCTPYEVLVKIPQHLRRELV